ncbi:hypothetical protein LIER_01721 [Lithospermum erythrorhizon]|uniref:Integrase catalytic domain-containing protein n=1 Tax=Lithospermum erythrorhizon TaxID=34254 RepID=A0AAV3NN57_LITER
MIQGELYKQSHLGPLLFYVSEAKIDQTLYEDAVEYVKRYDVCQIMQSIPRHPVTEMSLVVCPILFSMWDNDLVGQFLKPPVRYKDVVVAVDYFSKWVEVASLRSMTAEAIKEFLWKNIITRYGVPKILVSDNGPHFDSRVIEEMCAKLGIKHRFAPICYPQYNGQVETTPSNSTGETPFSLVYGTEAVLPIEVCLPSIRQIGYHEKKNDERLRKNLDFIDEVALGQMQKQKQAMSRFYNRRVKNRQFSWGDLVLRVLQASQPKNQNKLNPK